MSSHNRGSLLTEILITAFLLKARRMYCKGWLLPPPPPPYVVLRLFLGVFVCLCVACGVRVCVCDRAGRVQIDKRKKKCPSCNEMNPMSVKVRALSAATHDSRPIVSYHTRAERLLSVVSSCVVRTTAAAGVLYVWSTLSPFFVAPRLPLDSCSCSFLTLGSTLLYIYTAR